MKIGIIGGSAFYSMNDLKVDSREMINTPYGTPSSPVVFGSINGGHFVFLHRHGFGHTLAPHKINYRANIWALKQLGVTHIIAISAVGGITEAMEVGKIVLPHQIIDYTHSREHTYYDDTNNSVVHVDFTQPYDAELRNTLRTALGETSLAYETKAVHGVTQGPRLESAAEINRLERDGCDIVGMTGMPEAGLACESGLKYVCCAVVVNKAAGKNADKVITMKEIKVQLATGMQSVHELLEKALPILDGSND